MESREITFISQKLSPPLPAPFIPFTVTLFMMFFLLVSYRSSQSHHALPFSILLSSPFSPKYGPITNLIVQNDYLLTPPHICNWRWLAYLQDVIVRCTGSPLLKLTEGERLQYRRWSKVGSEFCISSLTDEKTFGIERHPSLTACQSDQSTVLFRSPVTLSISHTLSPTLSHRMSITPKLSSVTAWASLLLARSRAYSDWQNDSTNK